jgi:hypothetical protein
MRGFQQSRNGQKGRRLAEFEFDSRRLPIFDA